MGRLAQTLGVADTTILPSPELTQANPLVASYAHVITPSKIMPNTLEMLEAEALKLSPSDRSRLAERLVASLDEDAETEAAWDAVADLREATVGAESSKVLPFDDVMARLEARFPE